MTHRRLLPLAALAALALVLAACEVTVKPGPGVTFPPSVAASLDAQFTFPPSVQAEGVLAPGDTRYYELDVASGRELVYAAIQGETGLRVSLFTASGTRLAVSESSTFFGASIAAITSSADSVAGSSLSVNVACPGPCVAVPAAAASYVIVVSNPTGSNRSYDLYAFAIDETDEYELNDSVGSPTLLNGAGNYVGAIEVLGDVDYFVYNETAGGDFFVVFDPFDAALGLELEIVNCPTCEVLDGTVGFRVEGLFDGDILRVRSAAGRAGPNATSGYSLEVTATAPAGASVSSR